MKIHQKFITCFFNYKKIDLIFLWIWFIASLLVGLILVPDYGISIDEVLHNEYAQDSIDAYKSFFAQKFEPVYGPARMKYYGPVFSIIANIIGRFATSISIAIPEVWAWHYTNFLAFQLTGICIYYLSRRWFHVWTSWTLYLLFVTQPLLWGHAFINAKDIPFMFFFIFSILLGFKMIDSFDNPNSSNMSKLHEKKNIRVIFLTKLKQTILSPTLILAGIALGLTISVRNLGPIPGMTILLILWINNRQVFLSTSISYLTWAGITTYLTWPYLWASPISRYIETIQVMANYTWEGKVLFNGYYFDPEHLPLSYLPVLLNIQFTEPFLILFYLGIGIITWKILSRKVDVDLLIYSSFCALIPILFFIIFRIPLYDNFRHLLFLVPPLFMISGVGIEFLYSKVSNSWIRLIVISTFSIIGIGSIIKLHPYQYIYYNSFIGGVRGVFRKFELDYWYISHLELVQKLNTYADKWSTVFIDGPSRNVDHLFLRPDLLSSDDVEGHDDINCNINYAIINSRGDKDEILFPHGELIEVVERSTAILGVVKSMNSSQNNCINFPPLSDKNNLIKIDKSFGGMVGIIKTIPGLWDIEIDKGNGFYWLGEGKNQGLKWFIWSDVDIPTQLLFKVIAGPGREDSIRNLALNHYWYYSSVGAVKNQEETGIQSKLITFNESLDINEVFILHKGLNEFQLISMDDATIDIQPNGDTRPLIVHVSQIELHPENE